MYLVFWNLTTRQKRIVKFVSYYKQHYIQEAQMFYNVTEFQIRGGGGDITMQAWRGFGEEWGALLCTYWGACSPEGSVRVKQVTQQDGSPFFFFLCKTQQAAGGYWPTRSTMEPLFNTEHLTRLNFNIYFLKVPHIPEVWSKSCIFFTRTNFGPLVMGLYRNNIPWWLFER